MEPRVVQLRVLNQKDERDFRLKLDRLEKEFRYTCRMLQRRQHWLRSERRRVLMVKACEPKATVDVAMKEIITRVDAEVPRSVSAPLASSGGVRLRRSLSFVQVKSIAAIDTISEREMEKRRREAREQVEKTRLIQRERLHDKVTEFIQRLQDKNDKRECV